MSVTYRIDPVQGVVYTTFEGTVTDQQFLQHAREIESDPRIDGSFVELIQADTTSMAGVTSEGVRKTAHALRASKAVRKIAIVGSQDVEFGLARMVALLADESRIEIRAFREQTAARSWFGQKPPLTEADVLALISADPWMMRALRSVARLGLADWWIVAGFVRSKVWDSLHGYSTRTPIGDIDVVFFSPSSPPSADREIERRLTTAEPSYLWEVYNQAHMHSYNNDAPYRNSIDSFSRWAETVSTVGVRLTSSGGLELASPHGLADLVQMVVRLTPHPDANRDVFRMRLGEKRWSEVWPQVRVVDE